MRSNFGLSEKWVFKQTACGLLDAFEKKVLPRSGYNQSKIRRGAEFVYAPGRIPVLMVAHVDTVHRQPPENIFHDQDERVLWSPEGLGADDRAGVLGILELLRRGHRPHVLLLDGEERGCTGAQEAVNSLRDPGVLFAIELDRRNGSEAVFYDCANEKFQDYILGFGFKKAEGTFTDITTICPAWGFAGVNLSCGYYNAHTTTEYLKLPELWHTIGVVEEIFKQLPRKRFKYVAKKKPVVYPVQRSSNNNYYDQYRQYCQYNYRYSYWRDSLDITIFIDPDELALLYGGDTNGWEDWLEEKEYDLHKAAEQAVYDRIEQLIGWEVPNCNCGE